jgi:hypothetical protein
MSVSLAKQRANQRNAQKSTGPRTAEGKAASARNAITHGVFCKDLLLADEDPSALKTLREGVVHRFNPRDSVEAELVEQYLSCTWRLKRLRRAEISAYECEAQLIKQRLAEWDEQHPEKKLPGMENFEPRSGQVMCSIFESEDRTLEKLGRYEQQLFSTMLRCSKELRVLQREEVEDEANVQNEPTAPRPANVQNEPTAPAAVKLQNEPTVPPLGFNLSEAQQLATTVAGSLKTPAARMNAAIEKALYPGAIPTPKSPF